MQLELPANLNIADEFIARPAGEHPDRIAILGQPAQYSYREVASAINRVAAGLKGLGCSPGDRVLIVLPDSLEFIASFFAAAKIGAVAVPVNSFARAADYEYWTADSGARIAIVHYEALPEFSPASTKARGSEVVVVGSKRGPSERKRRNRALLWDEWLGARSREISSHPTRASDPAFLLYTSGSGGRPKAAIHCHGNMLFTSRSFAQDVLGLRAGDRCFSVSKLFFAYGLGNGMYFPFSVGAATLLYPGRPRVDKVVELVERHQPTLFFSVPTFYAAILREADKSSVGKFSSVRLAVSAGEALPAEIFDRFQDRFGIQILDGIGSTEMLHMFISCRPGQARAASCGVPVPGYDARILDDAGHTVPTGEIGNLWVKGRSAFSGYWNLPELTARTKQGEWVLTGDKFFRDESGFFHYCGRSDDMMKVSGMWVSPGEVENALLSHPAVAEAAVVGRMDSFGLLRPMAYLVSREGRVHSAELARAIRDWVRDRLPSYKCPQEIYFVAELPKTATGKIQRFRLREVPGPSSGDVAAGPPNPGSS